MVATVIPVASIDPELRLVATTLDKVALLAFNLPVLIPVVARMLEVVIPVETPKLPCTSNL